MCGIVGYIGPKPCVPVIMEGLARLEYRGYDSAGIAVAGGPEGLQLRRAPGKLRNLDAILGRDPVHGTYGIGHTRWATHGRPTEENAHPHRDGTGTLVVVHNGIVENYLTLKHELIGKGHAFASETDTEIIAHLIQDELENHARQHGEFTDANESVAVVGNGHAPKLALEEAVRRAARRMTGAFAIGVLSANEPDKMVAARMGPPIVLGLGEGEFFLASDVPGILHHTRNIYFLADNEVATLTTDGVVLTDFHGNEKHMTPQRITWDPIQAEKAGYKHFMLKEINEQPRAVRDTTLGRVSFDTGRVHLGDMSVSDADLRSATSITIAACGTSWHAGLAGKFMIERLARLPVDVDYASEYRYRDPIPNPNTLGLLITQSGETADTIAAQQELIAKGSKTLAICNVVGSPPSRAWLLEQSRRMPAPRSEWLRRRHLRPNLQRCSRSRCISHRSAARSPTRNPSTTPPSYPRSPASSKTSSAPPTTSLPRSPRSSITPATSSSSAAASTTPSPSKARSN